MKHRISLLNICLAASFISHAQVNLQTGAAQFSIPLFSYGDPGNRLSTGISLMYTAGNGLKVTDVPTAVGTGWALDFGGVITRIQHGEPDDQKQDEAFPNPYPNPVTPLSWPTYVNSYYPNGYMYSEFDASTPVDNGGGFITLFPGNYVGGYKQLPVYLADREQDEFAFSFNGRQGKFVIGKNGTIRSLVDSKLKIDKVITNMTADNVITRISEFQITDEEGIKYIFRDLELNEILEYDNTIFPIDLSGDIIIVPGPVNITKKRTRYTSTPKNKFIVGKWFLSEVINPMTAKKITYTYESFNVDMPGNKSGYRSVTDDKVNLSITLGRIKGVSKRIKTITCSEKEEVEFIYSLNNRNDLSFDKALEEIKVKYNGAAKYSWKMEYAYFVKNQTKGFNDLFTDAEKRQSRLCLSSIRKFGGGMANEPPYTFEYYNNIYTYVENGVTYNASLEVFPLFSFYQDHYGYPSRWLSVRSDFLNEPNLFIALPDINWDHVENTTFNSFSMRNPYGIDRMAGTLKTVKYPFGGTLTYDYELNRATVTGAATQVSTGGQRVSKTIYYDGANHAKDIINEYKYVRSDGLSSGWGYEVPEYQNQKLQRVYDCGNGYKPSKIIGQVAGQIPSLMYSNVVTWGSFGTLDHGAGIRQQAVNNLIVMIVLYFLYEIFAPDYYEYTTYEWSTYSKTIANPLPVQYARVEVINKLPTGNAGKAVHEFTSSTEYPIDITTLAVPNSARPRFAFWAYGLPKATSFLDNTDKLLKKTEYSYQLFKDPLIDNNYVSQKWTPNKMTYDCPFVPGSGLPSNHIDHDIYYPFYGRTQLTQTKEYIYNAANEYNIVTTDYEYSPNNYQVNKVKTNNSKGELIETSSYYPLDYTLGGAVQTMRDNNIVNTLVSTQTLITKNGSQKYMVSGGVSEFGIAPNGDIKALKTYTTRSVDPVPVASVSFNAAQLIPNTSYYKEIGAVTYGSAGMPVQVNSEKGKTSSIYDYNNKLAIATVTNADYADIAYTSFESEGNGGWTFDPLRISEEFSPTGKKCLRSVPMGPETSITRNIINTKKYILSFWLKGSLPVMSGATLTLVKTYANTATGYTYYEYEVTNGTILKLTGKNGPKFNTLAFNLDEIRLYPAQSRMQTVTFDPIAGKTAECDENGRITYFEYDEMGRLKVIRDQNWNVIKAYEYNYKS